MFGAGRMLLVICGRRSGPVPINGLEVYLNCRAVSERVAHGTAGRDAAQTTTREYLGISSDRQIWLHHQRTFISHAFEPVVLRAEIENDSGKKGTIKI
jgi:hypothetical protein